MSVITRRTLNSHELEPAAEMLSAEEKAQIKASNLANKVKDFINEYKRLSPSLENYAAGRIFDSEEEFQLFAKRQIKLILANRSPDF